MILTKMYIFDIGTKIHSRAQNTIARISAKFYMVLLHIYMRMCIYIYMQKLEISERRSRQFENLYSRLPVKYYVLIFLCICVRWLRTYSHICIFDDSTQSQLSISDCVPRASRSNFKYYFYGMSYCRTLFFRIGFFHKLMDFCSVCIYIRFV